MENIYLRNLAKKGIFSVVEPQKRDKDAPFSFIEWKQQRLNYPEQDIYFYYQQYLVQWFEVNRNKSINQEFVLKQKYLYLLHQLQSFFTEEEKQTWYSKIDLASEKELLISIPIFAEKLKNISLYYLNARKKLKNTKIKYNHLGTNSSLEKEITSYILQTFSSLNPELDASIKNKLPQFENVKNTIQIRVEELYDDFNYFDKSSNVPLSSYYNLFDETTSKLFETKGLALSSDSWIFNSLNALELEDYNTYLNELTGNIFETTDTAIYQSLLENLLSERQILTEFTSTSSVTDVYDVPLVSGNNVFYYPYGSYSSLNIQESSPTLIPISLSSLDIPFATAGTNLSAADALFVKIGNTIKGAWLKLIDFIQDTKFMYAKIGENGNTSFIFPFPGYGLSAENVQWTGYSLSATEEYQFLSKKLKQSVDNIYWNSVPPADRCNEIYINNTTLIADGAYSNKNPNFSDRIFVYDEKPEEQEIPRSQQDDSKSAWLYRFERTSLPIYSASDYPTLFWPYQYLNSDENLNPEYPKHLSLFDYTEACNSVSVSSLNIPFAIASDSFSTAEKIYKLIKPTDSIETAVECCWLSGKIGGNATNQWVEQEGFSSLFESGSATRFIWTGRNNTPLSSVFSFISHSPDCDVIVNSLIDQPENCTCKQVYYSPYGHSGNVYEIGILADYIISYDAPLDQFYDLRDALSQTNEFAWYKTNSKYSDWGNGNWVFGIEGNQNQFLLQTGKSYIYYRSSSKTQDKKYPSYVVNYKFNNVETKPKWIQAKRNPIGEWVSANVDASTRLNSGDFLKWHHPSTLKTLHLSSYQIQNETRQGDSLWCTNQTIVLNSTSQNSTTVFWPHSLVEIEGVYDTQVPRLSDGQVISLLDVERINRWVFTHTQTGETQSILNTSTFTFIPKLTGTYNVSVEAVVKINSNNIRTLTIPTTNNTLPISSIVQNYFTEVIQFTGIPQLSVVPQYRTEYTYVSAEQPTSGYLLEQQLYGWNYNTNQPDPLSLGAKPFWAELYTDKSTNTRYKGILSWGYPVKFIDGYLPNLSPTISPLLLSYGNVVDYDRKGVGFVWKQNLTYDTSVNTTQWCQLTSDVTGSSPLSSFYEIKNERDPVVFSKSEPSDIILTNIINGYPVEIYYYALNNFTWSISATYLQANSDTETTTYINDSNIYDSNRFFPTIATVPVAQELYSVEESGGYFTPQYLAASQYVNQNFTPFVSSGSYFETSLISQDPNKIVGGRGFSKENQTSPYSWIEDNQWLKEPPTTNALAGSVRKSLTKNMQTFVPYKNSFTEKPIGLINSGSRLTPWGGKQDEEWVDNNNKPQSFTGVYNVTAWSDSQFLKRTDYNMEGWVSDIYGNQYGLFKQTDVNDSIYSRSQQAGELWVRTNAQNVLPGSVALSGVFNFYKNLSGTNVYQQLTNSGITNIDCFYDTLMIQTSSILLFARIGYDYDKNVIDSSFDDIRNVEINSNQFIGQSWFISKLKKIVTPVISLSSHKPTINIFELNLPTFSHLNVELENVNSTIHQNLSSFDLSEIAGCVTSYDSDIRQLLVTTTFKTSSNNFIIVDLLFDVKDDYSLNNITTYTSHSPLNPPSTANPNDFIINFGTIINQQLTFTNNPLSASLVNYQEYLTLNPNGILSGTLPNEGIYFINYQLANQVGSNTFGLTISCASPLIDPEVIDINTEEEFYIQTPYVYITSQNNDKSFVIGLDTIGKIEILNYYTASSYAESFIDLACDLYVAPSKTRLFIGETATLSSIANTIYTFYYLATGNNNKLITALTYGSSPTKLLSTTNTFNSLIS